MPSGRRTGLSASGPCRAADSPMRRRIVAGPYLGDTLTMGSAFLALYAVTGGVRLAGSGDFRRAIHRRELQERYGIYVDPARSPPAPDRCRSMRTPRSRGLRNLLNHYSGRYDLSAKWRSMPCATSPLQGLRNAGDFRSAASSLRTASCPSPPLHITIVGAKNDPAARSLFLAASEAARHLQAGRVAGRSRRPAAQCGC